MIIRARKGGRPNCDVIWSAGKDIHAQFTSKLSPVGIIIRISEVVIRQYHHITMPSTKAQPTYRRAFNPRLQSATLWGLVLSIRSLFWWSYHPSLSVSLTQGEDVVGLVQSPVVDLLTTSWATHRSTWICPPLMSFTGTILAINKPHYR